MYNLKLKNVIYTNMELKSWFVWLNVLISESSRINSPLSGESIKNVTKTEEKNISS